MAELLQKFYTSLNKYHKYKYQLLMHSHPNIDCFIKIQNGLPFWCRLTQVVLEKRLLN